MHMTQLNMLLFSGGQSQRHQPYYHYCAPWLQKFLNRKLSKDAKILFISWAVWGGQDADAMFRYGCEHWGQFGLTLIPLHRESNYHQAIAEADAIIVGGGSIHFLVHELEEHQLMQPIRDKIKSGCLYIGTSAGAVITGPTMHTASEPPLLHIPSHKTLNILPFQLNAHFYLTGPDQFHHGPTPEARIKNYLQLNPDPRPVLCMQDGSFLYINSRSVTAMGIKDMILFDRKLQKHIFQPGDKLTRLLRPRSKYYKRI